MPDLTPPKETQEPAAKTAELPAPAPAALPEKPQSKVKVFVLIGCIALVLPAAVIVGHRMVHRGLPEGLIQANGRIEGDRIRVASKFVGRISRMFVREGDSVAALASQLDQGRAVHVEAESVLKDLTPEEVQTSDERVKLVFAVKLYLTENPNHRLSPGLPADAVIRWQEEIAWHPPRW